MSRTTPVAFIDMENLIVKQMNTPFSPDPAQQQFQMSTTRQRQKQPEECQKHCTSEVDNHPKKQPAEEDREQEKHCQVPSIPHTDNDAVFAYIASYDRCRPFNENEFMKIKRIIGDNVNISNHHGTLLQQACAKGHLHLVRYILERKGDCSRKAGEAWESPIEIASRFGYHVIFELLLCQPKVEITPEVVLNIARNIGCRPDACFIDYRRCFDLLYPTLKENAYLVFNGDEVGDTPLHYVVRSGDEDVIHRLLKLGASLTIKNRHGLPPLEHINPGVLERYFDRCIRLSPTCNQREFIVKFKYGTLLPEMELIRGLQKRKDLRYLLAHPLISNILLMKWSKLQYMFYVYATIYLLLWTTFIVGFVMDALVACQISFVGIFTMLVCDTAFLSVDARRRFTLFSTLIKLSMLLSVFIVLVSWFFSDWKDQKQWLSTAMVVATIDLVLFRDIIPVFTSYALMFRKITTHFLQLLVYLVFLMVTFAVCFYALLYNSKQSLDLCLLSTVSMFVGEMNPASIEFEELGAAKVIMFLLFTTLMTIAFSNLITAVAIWDVKKIYHNDQLARLLVLFEHVLNAEALIKVFCCDVWPKRLHLEDYFKDDCSYFFLFRHCGRHLHLQYKHESFSLGENTTRHVMSIIHKKETLESFLGSVKKQIEHLLRFDNP